MSVWRDSTSGPRAAFKAPWSVRFSRLLLFVQGVLWAVAAVGLWAVAVHVRRSLPGCSYDCDSGEAFAATMGGLIMLGWLAYAAFALGLASLSWLLAIRLTPTHVDAAITATGLELLLFVLFAATAVKGGVLLLVCTPCAAFALTTASCLVNPPTWRFIGHRR